MIIVDKDVAFSLTDNYSHILAMTVMCVDNKNVIFASHE